MNMNLKIMLACGTAIAGAGSATAQTRDFAVPAMPASKGVQLFARQAGVDIIAPGTSLKGVTTNAVKGKAEVSDAINRLLSGTKLRASRSSNDVYLIKTAALAKNVMLASLAEPAQRASVTDAGSSAAQAEPFSSMDIVVTARKRTENLRDVPVAITALTGDAIVQKNVTQLNGLSVVVPNFYFTVGAVFPLTFIRGFGSGSSSSFEQSVGKFTDNVSYGRDVDGRLPIFDVERLEVLKGPQVLTFGNSATAGAINITTKKPGDEFEANGSIGYEFVGREINTQLGVTVPLMEGVSFRIAGLYQDLAKGPLYNPVKDDHEVNTRNIAIRPTLRIRPVALDGLDIVLRAEVDRLKDFGSSIVQINQPLTSTGARYPVVGSDSRRYINYNVAPFYSDEFNQMDANLYQADVNYTMLGGVMTSTTAWRKTDNDLQYGNDGINNQTSAFFGVWQHYKQFSQELRFSGTYGKLDVTVGGYYQRDTLSIDAAQQFTFGGLGFTGAAATPFARNFIFDQKTRVYSGFVDLTYRVTDALSLSGGVRYADSRKRAGQGVFAGNIIPGINFDTSRKTLLASRNPALDPIYSALLGAQHNFPFGTLQHAENHWQPQAIVQYEFAPDNKGYVKFVRGSKAGGFDFVYTGTSPAGNGYDAETASMFEAGLKGRVLDNQLDYSIAIFRETFTDLQQSANNGVNFVVSNVGKARSQGIELEMQYRPDSDWRFGFNGGYTDAKYVEFRGAACGTLQNAGLQGGCGGTPRSQDLSGAPTQGSSKWSGSFSVDYTKLIDAGQNKIGIGASVFARSKYDPGAYNDRRMEQKGFAQLDVHADFGPADGRWNLSLFGRNLTDQRPLVYTTLTPLNSTAVLGGYGSGRQIGVKLSFAMQ
jgi:iron complex outermembrane receptor protein